MKKFLFVLVVMGLVLSSGPVWAKDGFYLGMDLGVAVAPEMDVQTGGFDDWTPVPDGTSFPGHPMRRSSTQARQVQGAVDNELRGTLGPAKESFDGGSGILAGLAVGYRLGSFRVEGEYFYRNTKYDSTATPNFRGIPIWYTALTIRMSRMPWMTCCRTTSLPTCITTTARTRSLPRMWALASGSPRFRSRTGHVGSEPTNPRSRHQVFETTGPEGAAGIALNKKLAGTLTHDQARMSDTLFGYQALAGVDYQVSEPLTIGLKFRYAMFGEFEDESDYTKLRGHASAGRESRNTARDLLYQDG